MPAAHKKVLRAHRRLPDRRAGDGALPLRGLRAGRTPWADRAATGIARVASATRPRPGSTTQTDRLLPCPYFLVTFTLPAELRDVARAISGRSTRRCSRPRARRCAPWRPTRSTSARIGWGSSACCTPGAGRWSIIPTSITSSPAAGSSADGDRWLASRADFLVPVKALSIVFRAKFRDLLRREGLLEQVDPSVWRRDWVVHCQPAGDGRESLRYLAPYVFRVAIGDHRIVSCDDGRVTFTYRKVGSKRQRKMTLDAMEFLRRFLQHVLPSGFAEGAALRLPEPGGGAVSLELVRWLIALWAGLTYVLQVRRGEERGGAGRGGRGARRAAAGWCGWGSCRRRSPAAFDTS